MIDAIGQEIQLGDLVVFKRNYKRTSIRIGRIIGTGINKIMVVYPSKRYVYEGNQHTTFDSYEISGWFFDLNCVVLEREFIQPDLKIKLTEWKGKNKNIPLHEFLGMAEIEMNQWIRTRLLPIERK